MHKRLTMALLGSALMLAAVPAHADLVTSLTGYRRGSDGNYAYTYTVTLDSASQLDAVSNGTPVQFGTVYDFGNLISAGTTPYIGKTGLLADAANQFTFSFDLTNAPASQTGPTDDATLRNVRFTYIGKSTITGTSLATNDPATNGVVGTFEVYSTLGVRDSAQLQYDGQSYKSANDTIQGNVGFTNGPAVATPPTSVPEPTSLALLGLSVASITAMRRRRAS